MASSSCSKGKRGLGKGFAAPAIPFFPFVSVLISTMGVLVLLVVIIGQRARLAASRQTLAAQAKTKEELHDALELAEWEVYMLQEAVRAGTEKIRDLRLALGHLEDHFRRLRDRREQLMTYLQRANNDESLQASVDEIRGQIAAVRKKIEAVASELEALRRKQGRRYFSIVPYGGPFGSTRWPIYIECRRDSVVIQPEGIVLYPEDFQPELGPGNPLEVALRAIREFWSRTQGGEGEPYPLLLVRPSGVVAYYVARAALETWNGEFGYELIDEDWEIVYPPPNRELQQKLTGVVEEARAKARLLAELSPRRLAAAPRRFILSPDRGGLIPEGGPSVELPLARRSSPSVSQGPEGFLVEGTGREGLSGEGRSGPQPSIGRDHDLAESRGRAGGTAAGSSALPPVTPSASRSESTPAGTSGNEPAGRGLPDSNPGPQNPPVSVPDGRAESRAGGIGGFSPRSLAELRGQDWAVPAAVRVLVPLSRPVRLECRADLLILHPEPGLGRPIVIAWEDSPENTIDSLVRELWQYVASWGPAGRGMAWRPVLKVTVAPGGEERFELLKGLLAGSGLSVELAQ